jgi:hypothetical protein
MNDDLEVPISGRDGDVLCTARHARRVIFTAVSAAFAKGDALTEKDGGRPSVWSAADVFIGQTNTIDLTRGIFEIEWRSPVLRLSLALRLGDVRIGIIIPRYNASIGLAQISEDERYPKGGRGCERIVRELGERHILFDYIFSGSRLGDDALTRRALSGDAGSIALLSDALFFEARHLREGVVHAIHESGVLLQLAHNSGVMVAESNEMAMEIETRQSHLDLCELTGLPAHSVIFVGSGRGGMDRFVLLVPEHLQTKVFLALSGEPLEIAA